jgi:toxin ParE1/3/4
MHKNVRFIDEAQREFLDIVDYYEQIYSGLGLAFKKEVNKVVDLITLFPDLCSKRQDGTQRMSTHRFPYQVIFFLFQDTLWIVSVAHHKRFPEYWKNRLKFEQN